MKFNWDNKRLGLIYCPPFACGQWVNNCMSYSKYLIPCSPTTNIEENLQNQGEDYYYKHKKMMSYLPDPSANNWHYDNSQYYDSGRWTCMTEGEEVDMEGPNSAGLIWHDATIEMREYLDKFWRTHAKLVSNSSMGFLIKCHYQGEALGLRELMPNIKIITFKNFKMFQDSFVSKVKEGSKRLSIWRNSKYDASIGLSIDLFKMLTDEKSFIVEMEKAFQYMGLYDFIDTVDYLCEYRNAYLKANIKFIPLGN